MPLPSPSDSLIHSLNTPSHVGFPGGAAVKNPPANVGDTGDVGSVPGSGGSPGDGGSPEEMAVHSNILAWEISWTEKPDGP